MSYVPPHARNRKEPAVKEKKVVDAEFPTFVPSRKPVTNFKGPSFAEKASTVTLPQTIPEKEVRSVHVVKRSRVFEEHFEDDVEDEESPEPTRADTTDGWQVVERKIRVKKDKIQDALDNGDAPIEEDDESAWDDQVEEHETYWDERRH